MQQWGDRAAHARKELVSLIGLLNHACKVVHSRISFLHRMLDLLHTVLATQPFIRLNAGFRSDLAWCSFVPRPLPCFQCFLCATSKTWEWPGDETSLVDSIHNTLEWDILLASPIYAPGDHSHNRRFQLMGLWCMVRAAMVPPAVGLSLYPTTHCREGANSNHLGLRGMGGRMARAPSPLPV